MILRSRLAEMTPENIKLMLPFAQKYLSIASVGYVPVEVEMHESAPNVHVMLACFYHPYVTLENGGCRPRCGMDDMFVPRVVAKRKLMARLMSLRDKCGREELMSNESEGGIFQSCSPKTLWDMFQWLDKEGVQRLIRHRPSLGRRRPRFMDLGAGQNIVCLFGAAAKGWMTCGIELDSHRVNLAAQTCADVLMDPHFSNLRISLFEGDIKEPSNWVGYDIYYLWDKVFNEDVVHGAYLNIHRCMISPVVLVQSKAHIKDRLALMKEYFIVEQIKTEHKLTFKGGRQSDHLQMFILSARRIDRHSSPVACSSILSQSEKSFSGLANLNSFQRLSRQWEANNGSVYPPALKEEGDQGVSSKKRRAR